MLAKHSMSRDLFPSLMRWCGWIHHEEVQEGFLSHADVKKDFVSRKEVKEHFQTMPLKTLTLGSVTHGTSIARTWYTEDARLCKLCPECSTRLVGEAPGESAKAEKEHANEVNDAAEKRYARVSSRFRDLYASVKPASLTILRSLSCPRVPNGRSASIGRRPGRFIAANRREGHPGYAVYPGAWPSRNQRDGQP